MGLFPLLDVPEVSAHEALIALVMRRSGVQIPEAAPCEVPLAFGLVLGRVDCFSTASQPPVRHRATSLPTQTVEIPYWRATAPWD